jgi:hypothetical protein
MAGIEHALFLILLLSYLLRDLRGKNQAGLYLIAGGLLLVLLPPFILVEIPWIPILALILPWIFWQNGRLWLKIDWRLSRREVTLWLITVISLAMIVAFIGNLPWIRAFLFGIIAASMLWQVSSREGFFNPLGNLGSLTLVLLLVETSLTLDAPWHSVGSLFSGAGVGMALALLSIAVVKKVPLKFGNWISLGQVYLAYWTGLVIGASAIAAALISVVVFVEFNQGHLDNKDPAPGSVLLANNLSYFVAFGLFIFTAWQTHPPATLILCLEVSLGLCISLLITILGRRWGLPRFQPQVSVWHSAFQLSLFLLGILILWPREPELGPVVIWIALGSAVFLPVLSAILVAALRDMNARRNKDGE